MYVLAFSGLVFELWPEASRALLDGPSPTFSVWIETRGDVIQEIIGIVLAPALLGFLIAAIQRAPRIAYWPVAVAPVISYALDRAFGDFASDFTKLARSSGPLVGILIPIGMAAISSASAWAVVIMTRSRSAEGP
jgi:hypothetical protein